MQVPFDQLYRVLVGEVFLHRKILFIFFLLIAIPIFSIGLIWPKTYSSSTAIFVDERNIIRPLMEGTAVATRVTERSRIAREIIYSRKIMDKIIEEGGWLNEKKYTVLELEALIENIKKKIDISRYGDNLLRIVYKDTDPVRAYKITNKIAELFIEESLSEKNKESKAAFDFINKQVNEYHSKLLAADNRLKEFRTRNADTTPSSGAEAATNINRLKREIEQTNLALKEEKIKIKSLEKQLSGEAEITASISREGQYQARIVELQGELDSLRLVYHESHPDVVRLRHQIIDLKGAIEDEKQRRKLAKEKASERGEVYVDQNISVNPLHQRLRAELSKAKTQVDTLKARLAENQRLLESERNRATRIHGGEAEFAELTRDYQVNQNIYQDLLRRRENARVSMNLDREQHGLSFKIQEPAILSYTPTGIRFFHFVAGSLILGFGVPLGLLYIKLQIDPRIRFQSVCSSKLNIPVVSSIQHLSTQAEKKSILTSLWAMSALFIFLLAAFGYVSWLKWTGALEMVIK